MPPKLYESTSDRILKWLMIIAARKKNVKKQIGGSEEGEEGEEHRKGGQQR